MTTRNHWLRIVVAILGVSSVGFTIPACATSQIRLYFDGSVADAGSLGGAAFDAAGNFWLIGFGGEQRIRYIANSGGSWSGTDMVVSGELALFGRADNLPAGNANSDWGPQIGTSPNALLLNPAPLSIQVPTGTGGTQTIVYPARSLAFIADSVAIPTTPTGTSRPDVAKKLYRYDLREVLAPTTSQPDFNTARGIAGGPVIGQFGRADWNDVFQPLMSELDLRVAAGGSGSDSFGRQFAWSSNGQSIYAIDSSQSLGGLYRIDATRWANSSSGVTRIWDDGGSDSATDRASMRSEPTVVPTSVFDFAPSSPLVGDQIVVEGSFNAGNSGGISVFVDTGSASLAAPTVLFDENQFRNFSEYRGTSRPRYVSIASDPTGNLYFYEQQTDGLYKYDTLGRFVKILSEREHNAFQAGVTGNSNGNDDKSNISVRTVTDAGGFSVTELVFVDSTLNAPIGVLDYKVGDFDRNNLVNSADFSLFTSALRPRGVAADDVNNRFDLNGNAVLFPDPVTGVLEHLNNGQVVVDWKDVKTLQQFVAIPTGDVNFDLALNFTDLDVLNANYFTLGGGATKKWTTGDIASVDPNYAVGVADTGIVNTADLLALADAWVNDLTQPVPTTGQLTGRGYTGQFLTDVIAAFSSVGNPLPGDANSDGKVDLLDLDILGANFGAMGATLAQGDFNADTKVDLLDLDILGANFGAMAAQGTAVPEPTAIVASLLGAASGFLVAGRRG